MNPLCNRLHTMRDALDSPDLFANVLPGASWDAWRVLLIASQGEPLTEAERTIFTELTGRSREPLEPVDEFWNIVGRRGGKTRALAVLGSYLAGCVDYSALEAPGERLKLVVMAQTVRTARKAFGYISGIFEHSPELRQLLVNKSADPNVTRFDMTQDTIRLATGVDIEVVPANFKTVRAETLIAALCDEVAYWDLGDYSANPDTEILEAIRPGLATTGGPLCVLSSPYARKGELYTTFRKEFGEAGDPAVLVVKAPSLRMNATLDPRIVARAYERDAPKAGAEYGAEFRKDVEAFVTLEAVQACMAGDLRELAPSHSLSYTAFADPSGGGADAMTLAIGHAENGIAVLDAVRELHPGGSPDAVVEEFATLLKTYRVSTVTGDRYAGEWPRERFRVHGITYEVSERSKSDIYREFLPILNSQRTRLLNVPNLEAQLVSLERRTSRGTGKDIIDHPQLKGAHDDVANAVAGVVVLLQTNEGGYDPEMWARLLD